MLERKRDAEGHSAIEAAHDGPRVLGGRQGPTRHAQRLRAAYQQERLPPDIVSEGESIPQEPKEPHIGVVIVHRIGSQPRSDTLRWFGDKLISWLDYWHAVRQPDLFRVEASHLSYGDLLTPDEPARVELRLPRHSLAVRAWPAQHWTIAEAWWESSLAAPDLKQMLAWSWQHLRSAAGSVFVEFIRRLVYVAGLVALPGSALVTGVSPSLAAGVAAFVQRRYEAFTRRLWPYGRGIAAVEFIG